MVHSTHAPSAQFLNERKSAMRITRLPPTSLLLTSLLLGGCALAEHSLHRLASPESKAPPSQEDRETEKKPRTEKDLSAVPKKPYHSIGHARIDLHGGAFTDGDLDQDYSSVWGIAMSLGVFVHEHISVGGLLDWSTAFGDADRKVSGNREVDVDLTMNMITFAPMVWFHSTSPQTTTSRLRPDFMIGLGPAVVWAEEEVTWGSWPFFESSEDESGVGYGFVAEALVEFPVSDRLTLSAGVRYTSAELDELDVNGGTISGSAGIGFRF
jgi:hypothetical protein